VPELVRIDGFDGDAGAYRASQVLTSNKGFEDWARSSETT
jgi:hypothetical protein